MKEDPQLKRIENGIRALVKHAYHSHRNAWDGLEGSDLIRAIKDEEASIDVHVDDLMNGRVR